MKREIDEVMLSQLADGELDKDKADEVLLGVLEDEELRRRFMSLLRLRQATAPWRRQGPPRPITLINKPRGRSIWPGTFWRMGSLVAAAVIGGMLVLAGFWLADRNGRGDDWTGVANDGDDKPPAAVSREEMIEVARVFALHESVAGPLRWYAADEEQVRLAAAEGAAPSGEPIAIQLRLSSAVEGKSLVKTYVVVCRDRELTAVRLPISKSFPTLRLRLMPAARDGGLDLHYAIGMSGPGPSEGAAGALAGRRGVNLTYAPLGQLVFEDRLFTVEASAWFVRDTG